MGVPVGSELLDTISPQYIADCESFFGLGFFGFWVSLILVCLPSHRVIAFHAVRWITPSLLFSCSLLRVWSGRLEMIRLGLIWFVAFLGTGGVLKPLTLTLTPNIFFDHIISPPLPPAHGGVHRYRKIAKDDRRYSTLIIDRAVIRGAHRSRRICILISVSPFRHPVCIFFASITSYSLFFLFYHRPRTMEATNADLSFPFPFSDLLGRDRCTHDGIPTPP